MEPGNQFERPAETHSIWKQCISTILERVDVIIPAVWKGVMMGLKETSKFISLILRHKPETIGISLDEHGWADVQEMIQGINATGNHHLSEGLLEEIVRTDEKQRYSFNEDHTLIRANQGHSIPIDVELEKANPPDVLYHGSAVKYEQSIDQQGLIPKSRLYVHLSDTFDKAFKVGSRHGRPVVYQVDCEAMSTDNFRSFWKYPRLDSGSSV